jgi:uncharacterized protein (TIGR04255 family)
MPDETLPSYDRPPIAEVVAGTSFDRLPVQATAIFGAFWKEKLAGTFPVVQEQPPHIPPIERFGSSSFAPELRLQLSQQFPSPRFWFLTDTGDELLQLQPDWISCNWRKVQPDAEYGRWPSRRSKFIEFFILLDQYITESGMSPLVPRQCEVSYINHILPNKAWQDHGDLDKILKIIGRTDTGAGLDPEQASVNFNFAMSDDRGEHIGRLHIIAVPAYMEMNKQPVYQLELTARGAPLGPGLDGVMQFLDKGRDTIVRTFAAVTTPEIQREWGLK